MSASSEIGAYDLFPPTDQRRSVLQKFCDWALGEDDIEGVLLVGSYARGNARPDSDVDLVVIAEPPNDYIADTKWLEQCGTVVRIQREDYGNLRSVRVHFREAGEFEFGFSSPAWVSVDPIEAGTRSVIKNGSVVLIDKKRRLRQLQIAVNI